MSWSPISSRFQDAGRYAAIALGASIPISVALDNVLFFVVLLAWLAGGRLREKLAALRANPAALAALAFFALLLVGMTWGPGSAREGWYYLAKYKDLLLVAALTGVVAGERDKHLALTAFLGAMTVTLVLSYALWLGVLPTDRLPNRTPDNPFVFKLQITHGVLMALAAFLAATRMLRATRRVWRVLYAAGALLAAFNVLFMVEGRTGYLVLGILALYLGVAHWRWRGGFVAAAAIAVTLGAAHLANAPMFGRVALVETELQEWDAGRAGETSTGLRMNYYRTTASIVRDHPILGVGTGGFIAAYRDKIRGTSLPESNNPHNQYLLTAAQLGAVGLAALVAMFLVMWWQAGRADPSARIAVRGLLLTIAVGCLLNSFLIDHVEGLLFAWMAGVLLATPAPRTQAPRTIVLLVLRRLGDVLLATPLLRSLRRAYPEASIDVLVYAGQQGMLEGNPDCNRVIAIAPYPDRAGYAALLRGRLRRYDLALTTQANDRSHLYAWLFGRRRVGLVPDLRWSSAWKRASCSAYAVLDDVDTHTVLQNLVLADLLGIPRVYEVVPPHAGDAPVLENYVVLHPYPKFNYKQWTREGWMSLIAWLRGQGLRVVLSGGPDRDEKAYNASLAPKGEALDLTGKLPLGALAALYAKARLFVGPDTSTTHIAAACGVPTLALFGPTNPVKWGPWPAGYSGPNPYQRRGRQRVGNVLLLQGVQPPDLGRCVPCHLEGCERHIRSFSRCLTEMPGDPVTSAAAELLRS
jgi:ADP-heptose:LPS heptosyltransferase/O-antigen ligase